MSNSPTLVPQTSISISDLSLPYLRKVEDAYTQSDIVQNTIGVLFVQFIRDSLFRGQPELRWVNCDCILDELNVS